MIQVSNFTLIISFILFVILSGFFSSSETGMLSLNRYRLRHRARNGYTPDQRVYQMLQRPDRLLGVILIGNTFANVMASAVATVLAVRWFGQLGVPIATLAVTLILLVCSEITPKTFAAIHPEWIALPFSMPLKILLKILYPIVWVGNVISNGLLRCVGIEVKKKQMVESLSLEELRTVLNEAAGKVSSKYRRMLVSILDLAYGTVEDIMVPRNRIKGLDLGHDWATLMAQLAQTQHTWMPVYRGNLDDIQGMLHVRSALRRFAEQKMDKEGLVQACEAVYFIPEGTPLDVQLFNFQRAKKRIGMVSDEYGDIQGLATLEDILEDIVGEFTTDYATTGTECVKNTDGSYNIEGHVSIREINRLLNINLPTTGPRTLSGLIVEHLESLPETPVCLKIEGHRIEIVKVSGKKVAEAKIHLPPAVHQDKEGQSGN